MYAIPLPRDLPFIIPIKVGVHPIQKICDLCMSLANSSLECAWTSFVRRNFLFWHGCDRRSAMSSHENVSQKSARVLVIIFQCPLPPTSASDVITFKLILCFFFVQSCTRRANSGVIKCVAAFKFHWQGSTLVCISATGFLGPVRAPYRS